MAPNKLTSNKPTRVAATPRGALGHAIFRPAVIFGSLMGALAMRYVAAGHAQRVVRIVTRSHHEATFYVFVVEKHEISEKKEHLPIQITNSVEKKSIRYY